MHISSFFISKLIALLQTALSEPSQYHDRKTKKYKNHIFLVSLEQNSPYLHLSLPKAHQKPVCCLLEVSNKPSGEMKVARSILGLPEACLVNDNNM
jgi:hypothetical protein